MINKITQAEINEQKVSKLPTRPNNSRLYGGEALSPDKLKARFDALALLAIDRLNSLIEIMNNGDITDEIPVLTVGEGDDAQILTISELAEKVVDGSLPDIMKVTGSKTLRQFINEAYSAVGNVIAGSAPGSLLPYNSNPTQRLNSGTFYFFFPPQSYCHRAPDGKNQTKRRLHL